MKANRVLFAYNARIEIDESGNYFGNELNDSIVKRYQYLGRHVTFIVRQRSILNSDRRNYLPFESTNFEIKTVPEFNSPFKYIRNLSICKKIIEVEVSNTDILVARLPSTIGRLAITEAIRQNKPYLVEVVGCPWDALWNHSLLGKIIAPYAFLQMRKFVSNAPFVIYVTDLFLQKRYPNFNWNTGLSDVVINDFNPDILRDRLLKLRNRTNEKCLVIGTVASIDVPYKGQSMVFKAIHILKDKGWDIKYKLVGKGTGTQLKKDVAQLQIQENVEFIGQLPHSEIFLFLSTLDLYIQPSKQEGLPRALVEAMSSACPCIGANTGGIPELLNKDMIFEKSDLTGLVKIFEKLSSSKLIDAAIENFEKSKSFLPEVMEHKRRQIYNYFLERILIK